MNPQINVLLESDWARGSLVDDVRRGLGARPLTLPPRWLYDDHGSALFDQITRLPDYYPFAAERSILRTHAGEIAEASEATTLIELGSGTGEKTQFLLDAFTGSGQLERFVPVDVSEGTLRDSAEQIAARYPDIDVVAVVADFTLHLSQLPRGGRRMVAFLGGTIGNLYREERGAFLGALADVLEPGDSLLLGTDLVKSTDRLVAAYHDPLTEEFIRNSLVVLNRELGADFDPAAYSYVPFWDPHMQRIDMRLRAESPQQVRVPGADLELEIAAGEEIRVEISTKFEPDKIAAELEAAGLTPQRAWRDLRGDFALTLATKG